MNKTVNAVNMHNRGAGHFHHHNKRQVIQSTPVRQLCYLQLHYFSPFIKTGVVVLCLFLLQAQALAEIPVARQHALRHMLKQDCGACHGMTLKGGLGPALTVEALQGKSRLMLLATILEGRPGTPMPPWKPFLTEEEAGWLVDVLLQGQNNAL